jgi:hypothetical protein
VLNGIVLPLPMIGLVINITTEVLQSGIALVGATAGETSMVVFGITAASTNGSPINLAFVVDQRSRDLTMLAQVFDITNVPLLNLCPFSIVPGIASCVTHPSSYRTLPIRPRWNADYVHSTLSPISAGNDANAHRTDFNPCTYHGG